MLRAAHDYTESVDDYGYRSPGTWGPLLEVQEAAEEALSIITEFREVIFPYGPQDEPESAPTPPATTAPTPPMTPPASLAPAPGSAQSLPRLPLLKRRSSALPRGLRDRVAARVFSRHPTLFSAVCLTRCLLACTPLHVITILLVNPPRLFILNLALLFLCLT